MASSRVSVARVAIADAFTTTSYRFPPGDENTARKYVTLADASGDPEYLTLGTGQMEPLTIDGVIFNRVVGGNEVESAVAEDAALAVLKELTDAVIADKTLGAATIFNCRVTSYTSNVSTMAGELEARIDFTVSVESHL